MTSPGLSSIAGKNGTFDSSQPYALVNDKMDALKALELEEIGEEDDDDDEEYAQR